MNLLGAITGGVRKLAGAIGSAFMITNQTRSIVTQTKAIAMTEKRDRDDARRDRNSPVFSVADDIAIRNEL